MGDKRADPRGRVPSDHFDFPRVTGNSSQRRKWHKTQLNEGLVERCIKSCTEEGDVVIDPFAGTGTTLRVCKSIGRSCVTMDLSEFYCQQIAEEHQLEIRSA
jgi:site-specific DNA-methyltransferase (adenine-specific)